VIWDSCSGLQFFEPTTECLEFISMALLDLCGSLREFGLEPSPDSLLIVVVLLEEQASVITSKAANGYHFKTGQRKGAQDFNCSTLPGPV
jgi:hypothetical protein